MHSILRYKGNEYPTSIVKSIMQYYCVNPNVPSLNWGRDHEEVERQQYTSLMKNKRINFSVATIDPAYPYLGPRSDGIATYDCCGLCIIEIKCPFGVRDNHPTLDTALQNSQYFLKIYASGSVSLNRNHAYYTQIQGQVQLCHQVKCDFIVWTTSGIHIETVTSDKSIQGKIVSECKHFFVCYLLPELLTHKLQDNGVVDK